MAAQSMIERVGQAILRAERFQAVGVEALTEHDVRAARAAIDSMLRPSEAMLQAGAKALIDRPVGAALHNLELAYMAMIEAALDGS